MNMRNSALIVIVYGILSATVVLVFYVGYRLYFRPSMDAQLASISVADASRAGRPTLAPIDATFARPHRRQSFEEALRRIDELKRLLDERTSLLEERGKLLDKKTTECEKLSEEANEYFAMMADMVAPASANGTSGSDAARTTESEAMRAEMDRLEEELGQTDVADDTLEAALDAAEWELEQAYADLAEAQSSASGQGTQSPVESVATDLLVEAGASAVPALAAALTDENAEVRRWAAEVLGEIGGASIGAADALTMALRDDDLTVRQAAGEALVRIEADF